MKLSGAEIVVECLKREKVDTLFGYIGGAVIPIFDQLFVRGKDIKLVRPVHEQGGIHGADGYARVTGKTGVAIVTSGPGATNTVTGIATAFMDSVPLLVITGQITKSRIGSDAFQEADVLGMTMAFTKESVFVEEVSELEEQLIRGFQIARCGRPGPVVVDIPMDIQLKKTRYYGAVSEEWREDFSTVAEEDVKNASELIQRASKPLVLVGGGVAFTKASVPVQEFIEKFRFPFVTTVMGRGICGGSSKNLGGVGMHGGLRANYGIQNCDLLMALGVRFSDRITGKKDTFAKNARLIHVDIDEAELDKNIGADLPINACAGVFTKSLMKGNLHFPDLEPWFEELEQYGNGSAKSAIQSNTLSPEFVVNGMGEFFSENWIVVADVGQNQMWVAQYFPFKKPGSFITSGGLGTMGYALPASVGASLGGAEVLMVAGDGGFQMNIQELSTVSRYKLPLKMVVLDNSRLGMVRQWQDLMCEGRYSSTILDDNPNLVEITKAYGIPAVKVDGKEEFIKSLGWLKEQKGAALIQVTIDANKNVLPMVPVGNSLDEPLEKI